MANVISYKGKKYVRVDANEELSDEEKDALAKLERIYPAIVKELVRIERDAKNLKSYFTKQHISVKRDPEGYDLIEELKDRRRDLDKYKSIGL